VTEEGGREERKRKPWGEDKKKKEGIEKRKKRKEKKGKKERKNRKNKLSIFLEIVIHNLYVLSTPRF
jgi:hypothetical protein